MAAVWPNHGNVIEHMRWSLIALCACGAAASSVPEPASPPAVPVKPRLEPRPPIDIIAALAQPLAESSWIVPGPAQLVLGGTSLQVQEGAPRLEVSLLEEQGSDIRVGVRLEHARFALWMARSRLLAIVAREQRVRQVGAPIRPRGEATHVVLRRGAQVQRLGHEDGQTRVRYVGALEVEGWIPDEALSDRAPAGRKQVGRISNGRNKPLMVLQGAIIRAEPRWAGHPLAVVSHTYFVDAIKELDDAWTEVSYEDGDIVVHGYLSRRDPPGRTHRRKTFEPTSALVPNAAVRDGTCLYALGEPVGFIVGDREVYVEKTARAGWYTLAIDSPWGDIAFEARGATATELVTCGE